MRPSSYLSLVVLALSISPVLSSKSAEERKPDHPRFFSQRDFSLLEPFFSFYGLGPVFSSTSSDFVLNMTSVAENANGWHPGELAVHKLLRVPTSMRPNPITRGLPPSYGHRIRSSPLLALGAVDPRDGRVWTTLWGGERGFAQPVHQGILGVCSLVDRAYDPVLQALFGTAEVVGEGVVPDDLPVLSGLAIDLETRDRVKIAGKLVVGALSGRESAAEEDKGIVAEVQLAMAVLESLGNCPKYLNKRDIQAHVPAPQLVTNPVPGSLQLGQEALDMIEQADMFFMSSTNGQTMDTNHRGGPQGFVRVLHNSPESVALVYPEYSGNRLYQTLGNLHTDPRVGIAIPNFATSDVLYLSGTADLIVGEAAAAIQPHSKVIVKVQVQATRLVRDGLPVRGHNVEPSPYNPPVRPLANERRGPGAQNSSSSVATARLVDRKLITPTIGRFTFELETENDKTPSTWHAGQYITLDFSEDLDHGWSHMRDDDPTSLNDDFIRTFTISSPPPRPDAKPLRFEITARKHGPATGLLWRHPLRVPLSLPVLGFGGDEGFRIPTSLPRKERPVFVAGGVGITPLLAQLRGVLGEQAGTASAADFTALWSIRADDLMLAIDVFEREPAVAARTRLFVTGTGDAKWEESLEKITGMGASIIRGRLTQEAVRQVAGDKAGGARFYVCTGPEMYKVVVPWLAEYAMVSESFNY